MSDERKLIEVLILPVKGLAKFSATLNKLAEDGYVIENSCAVPAKDGGVIVYVLRDALAGEDVAGEDETPEPADPETLDATTTVGHSSGNGASLPEPTIVEASEG